MRVLNLIPEWMERLAQLGVELRDPDKYGFTACYYNNQLISVCTEDDPWAIQEVVAEGIPEEVVRAVSQLFNESERMIFDGEM
jgi:hypothetical protein